MFCAFVSVSLIGSQPKSFNTYGKSNAQIVQMGADGWSQFYGGHNNSINSDAEGSQIFLVAADHEIDLCLRNRSTDDKLKYSRLRRGVELYAREIVDLGAVRNNLGTLWRFQAKESSKVQVADILYKIVSHQPYRLHTVGNSVVLNSIDKIGQEIRQAFARGQIDRAHLGHWRQISEEAKSKFQKLLKVASSLDPVAGLWIHRFCDDEARNVL
jgi:hypothetical protein